LNPPLLDPAITTPSSITSSSSRRQGTMAAAAAAMSQSQSVGQLDSADENDSAYCEHADDDD